MFWAYYDRLNGAWGISSKPSTMFHQSFGTTRETWNAAKEWLSRRLRERRAEAMRPVIAIDADLRRLASMEEPSDG